MFVAHISLLFAHVVRCLPHVKGVIRSMLLPHLQEIRTSTDKDPERLIHSQQLFTALTEFLEAHGISEGIGARGGSVNGKSWKMQNIKTSHSGAARYKGRKVHTHKGHHFVVTTYTHPTWCDHCGNLLWGLMKQGWKCVDCGFDVHKAKDRTGSGTPPPLFPLPDKLTGRYGFSGTHNATGSWRTNVLASSLRGL